VQFFLVYIREAHAIDSPSPSSFKGIEDPITLEERNKVCLAAIEDLALPLPALVDDMQDSVNKAYAAQPDRLYLVSKNGKIAYAGGRGPGGFKPDELERAIEKELGR
jgi:hypothetical protein